MSNYSLKKCAVCGKEFTPTGPNNKYCSKECGKKVPHRKGAAAMLSTPKSQTPALTEAMVVAPPVTPPAEATVQAEIVFPEVGNGDFPVNGRELHRALQVREDYTAWFNRMTEYGFNENKDFSRIFEGSTGGRPSIDHALSLDMAKELAMIQRTPQGKRVREYFIEIEKQYQTAVIQPMQVVQVDSGIDAMIANAQMIAQNATNVTQALILVKQNIDELNALSYSFNSFKQESAERMAQLDEKIEEVKTYKVNSPNAQCKPSDLAQEYRRLSSQTINKWFEDAGLQYKKYYGKGKSDYDWAITQKARSMPEPVLVAVPKTFTAKTGKVITKNEVWLTGYGIEWVHRKAKEKGFVRITEEPEQAYIMNM